MPKNIVQVFKILDLEDANNECMNAVAANHGIKATFSTGSQAQYPPHPRTSYDQAAPSVIPAVKNNQG